MSFPEHTDELTWQAYRYASLEMSASETETFEEQLAHDQAAREALAAVVELTQSIQAVGRSQPTLAASVQQAVTPAETSVAGPSLASRALVWMQPVSWMCAGAAACLAVVSLWQVVSPAQPGVMPEVAQNSSIPPPASLPVMSANMTGQQRFELASAWVGLSGNATDGEAPSLWPAELPPLPPASEDLLAPDETESTVPAWLIKALTERQSEEPCQEGD